MCGLVKKLGGVHSYFLLSAERAWAKVDLGTRLGVSQQVGDGFVSMFQPAKKKVGTDKFGSACNKLIFIRIYYYLFDKIIEGAPTPLIPRT